MGKGDQKTRRGKLFRGTYGARRPRKNKKVFNVVSSTRRTPGLKPVDTGNRKKTAPAGKAGEPGQKAAEAGKEPVKE